MCRGRFLGVILLAGAILFPPIAWKALARPLNNLNFATVNSNLDVSILTSERVDFPPYFTNLASRATALDRNGYPHIVYGGDNLFHSYYDGSAWRTEVVDASSGVGEYAVIAIDTGGATDVIHIAYHDTTNDDLEYATNASGGWVTQTISTLGGSHISMALDSSGKTHIVFNVARAYLMYATNTTGGSFTVSTIGSGGRTGNGWYNSIVLDSADDIHVSYMYRTSGSVYGFAYAVKSLSVATWTVSTVGTAWLIGSSIGRDSADNLHVCYYDSANKLKYRSKPSGSAAWNGEQTLDTGTGVGKYCSLAVDDSDNIHIGYYDGTGGNLKYIRYSAETAAWGSAVTVDSASDDVGQNTAVAVGGGGDVHISYFDATNSAIKYATGNGSSWSAQTLVGRGNAGQHSSLAVDSLGYAHVAYYDLTNTNLKCAVNQSGSWAIATVDSSADVGQYAAIELDSAGKAHIVYYDATNSDLRYATNAGGSWAVSTVDSSGSVGLYGSLAIDSSDNLHAAYYEDGTTTDYLKYAVKPGGGTTWSTERAVGTTLFTGADSSIAVDPTGKVHIGYAYNAIASYELRYISRAPGGGWSSYERPDVCIGSRADFHNIAVTSEGDVVIVYTNPTSVNLAYTTNEAGYWDCESFRVTSNLIGKYNSLVLDERDEMFAAYYDETAGALKFITSDSHDNDGSWNTASLDSEGDTGYYTSLALDRSGYFHVSYYSASNGDLMYVKFDIDGDGDGSYRGGGSDCNDSDASIHPGSTEICGDAEDNDCDGSSDEEEATPHLAWYADGDGDGYGSTSSSQAACGRPSGYVSNSSDCDDTTSAISPDGAEVCGDSTDNDCDGNTDEGCVGETNRDDDGDGYTEEAGDCDDGKRGINPGAAEVCDGVDNDCDRDIDDPDSNLTGASTWYPDFDGDAHGDESGVIVACGQPRLHVARAGDCNDANSSAYPGAAELCGDGVDNDCDGTADEESATADLVPWYVDEDGDGYGTAALSVTGCAQPSGNYVANASDCDDADGFRNPAAVEACGDSKDNDCDGKTDEVGCEGGSGSWSNPAEAGGCRLMRED